MWLVGEYVKKTDEGAVWFYCGIFTTKDKAITACKNDNYFIVPTMDIDVEMPEERGIFPGVEYPIKTCHKD